VHTNTSIDFHAIIEIEGSWRETPRAAVLAGPVQQGTAEIRLKAIAAEPDTPVGIY